MPVPDPLLAAPLSTGALEHVRERLGRRHLETLGGCNHFLELDRDAQDNVWVLVHSGSGGLGAAVAQHHARAADSGCAEALAGLDVSTPSGSAYLADLAWALDFVLAIRREAAEVAHEALAQAPEAVRAEGRDKPTEDIVGELFRFLIDRSR